MLPKFNEVKLEKGRIVLRLRWAAIFGYLALMAALPLIYLYLNQEPLIFDTTVGKATVHFESSHSRLIFPGQCVTIKWDLEGIKTVTINGRGHVGHDSETACITDKLPTMDVNFQDGTEQRYRLAVERLYMNPLGIGLWALVGVGSSGVFYSFFGISGIVFVLSAILFLPITRLSIETGSDYRIHLQFQQLVLESGDLSALPPHIFHYGSVVIMSLLLPDIGLETANLIVLLLAYGLGSAAIYGLLRSLIGEVGGSKIRQALIYIPLTLSLWCVVPLVVSGNPLNTLVGRADIPVNMFNSPTLNVLKPFALLAFIGAARWLTKPPKKRPWLAIVGVAMAVIAGTLTKPNYTMALLPAVCLVLALQFIKPFRLNRPLIVAGILMPALAVLGWQYLRVFSPGAPSTVYNPDQTARIAIAPLDLFLNYWNFSINDLIVGFFLSILFPLVTYLAYFKVSTRNLILNLAWLVFLVGQSFAYIFIEIPHQAAGNMTWGGRITLFVLFAVSLGFFVRQNIPIFFGGRQISRDPRFYLCATVYVLHLIPYLQYAHIKIP